MGRAYGTGIKILLLYISIYFNVFQYISMYYTNRIIAVINFLRP